ncbi:MAG: hypothetical protein CM15mV91_330 [uncultured marine virus]|nr:MAG: hypothetical protein CM15mV91_330 [uncultured marine virus]
MLAQLYGNIGQADKHTRQMFKTSHAAGAPDVPLLQVQDPTALQQQMFDTASQGAANRRDFLAQASEL